MGLGGWSTWLSNAAEAPPVPPDPQAMTIGFFAMAMRAFPKSRCCKGPAPVPVNNECSSRKGKKVITSYAAYGTTRVEQNKNKLLALHFIRYTTQQ